MNCQQKKKIRAKLFMGTGYVAMDADGIPIPSTENCLMQNVERETVVVPGNVPIDFKNDALEDMFSDENVTKTKQLSKETNLKAQVETFKIKKEFKLPIERKIQETTQLVEKSEKIKERISLKPKRARKPMFSISGYETAQNLVNSEQSHKESSDKSEEKISPKNSFCIDSTSQNSMCLPFYAILLPQITSNLVPLTHTSIPLPQFSSSSNNSILPRPRYLVDIQVGLFLGLASGHELLVKHPQLSRRLATLTEKKFLESSPISEIILRCLRAKEQMSTNLERQTISNNKSQVSIQKSQNGITLVDLDIHFLREDEVFAVILDHPHVDFSATAGERKECKFSDSNRKVLTNLQTIELDLDEYAIQLVKTEMQEVKIEKDTKIETHIITPVTKSLFLHDSVKDLTTSNTNLVNSSSTTILPVPVSSISESSPPITTGDLKHANLKRVPLKAAIKMAFKKGDMSR
ncbi:hypothetical protein HK096_007102 [Nowakowskiella sp. JEL0078]|nr:hypothetical protein HK096_007102 [Nowakowskiella sp. JEL0078]